MARTNGTSGTEPAVDFGRSLAAVVGYFDLVLEGRNLVEKGVLGYVTFYGVVIGG